MDIIKTHIKAQYVKAARRLTGLNLLDRLFQKFLSFLVKSTGCPKKASQFIQKSMRHVIGWLSSIQSTDEGGKSLLLFHYMNDVKGCGV